MQIPRTRIIGLLLATLAMMILFLAWAGSSQATLRLQSPLLPQPMPCFGETLDGFTLEVNGYVNNNDGTTTITYRVANAGKQDSSYVAFGHGDWTPISPSDGITVSGELGDYHVEWTNERGNPGFASIKYESEFDGFGEGAEDTFEVAVADFDPTDSIQVQMKAGRNRTAFRVTLDGISCDLSPALPPTATPESPLPTPTLTSLPTETPAPTITPTPIVLPNGWHRRTDVEAGYTIDYPADSIITAGKNKGQQYDTASINFILPGTVGYQGMAIVTQENQQELPIEQYADELYEQTFNRSAPPGLILDTIKTGDISGYQIDFMPGSTDLQILIPYENKVYVLALVHSFPFGISADEAIELFYEIVATFTILP